MTFQSFGSVTGVDSTAAPGRSARSTLGILPVLVRRSYEPIVSIVGAGDTRESSADPLIQGLSDLRGTDVLPCEDLAEVDLAPLEADPPASGDGDRVVVEVITSRRHSVMSSKVSPGRRSMGHTRTAGSFVCGVVPRIFRKLKALAHLLAVG